MKIYDGIIIGAGAAGMAAAITAKQENPNFDLAILEKMDRPGLKVAAAGNGRCNITNKNCPDYLSTLKFLQSVGIMTRDDGNGWIYPYNEEAKSVVAALVEKIRSQGSEIFCGNRVKSVEIIENHRDSGWRHNKAGDSAVFQIDTDNGTKYFARRVVLSTGGKSGPKLGTTGDGFVIARNLGHTVNTLVPSLTTVETYEDTAYIAGVRAKASVTLLFKGIPVAAEEGEIQFTEDGISGICIYNLTRYMTGLPLESYSLEVDFFPGIWNIEEVIEEREALMGRNALLLTMLKKPLRKLIMDQTGGDVKEITKLVKKFPLKVKNLGGWRKAQVTRGGVDLHEISHDTMESTLIKNLFIVGEVLDYDGPCGGFNLNHAWQTGIKAGRAMAERF